MDSVTKIDLSKYRLERAKEDLGVARLLFDNSKYKDSNNRSYYSIFHSIKAVLALEEKDFKSHKAVLAYFNMQYVKTEIFPRVLGKGIKKASIIREASDYEDFYIASKEEAEEQLILANVIIKLVENYIDNHE